jgi:hypothetical protein
MNAELTKIIVMYNYELPLTAYKSNNIPRVGDILHFTHLGCFRTKSIVYRISDDSGLDENRLMWVEVFVDKYKEDHENEQRNI